MKWYFILMILVIFTVVYITAHRADRAKTVNYCTICSQPINKYEWSNMYYEKYYHSDCMAEMAKTVLGADISGWEKSKESALVEEVLAIDEN